MSETANYLQEVISVFLLPSMATHLQAKWDIFDDRSLCQALGTQLPPPAATVHGQIWQVQAAPMTKTSLLGEASKEEGIREYFPMRSLVCWSNNIKE